MLRCVGKSLTICKEQNRILVPITASHTPISKNFDELFDITKSDVITSVSGLDDTYKSILGLKGSCFRDEGRWGASRYFEDVGWREVYDVENLYVHELPPMDVDYAIGFGFSLMSSVRSGLNTVLREISLIGELSQAALDYQSRLPASYVAIHYRNTDYTNDLDSLAILAKESCDTLNCENIYIATDQVSSIERFKEKLPGYSLFSNTSIPTNIDSIGNQKSLHYISEKTLASQGVTRSDMHRDFFSDIAALVLSTHFIPSPRTSIKELVDIFRSNRTLFDNFYCINSKRENGLL